MDWPRGIEHAHPSRFASTVPGKRSFASIIRRSIRCTACSRHWSVIRPRPAQAPSHSPAARCFTRYKNPGSSPFLPPSSPILWMCRRNPPPPPPTPNVVGGRAPPPPPPPARVPPIVLFARPPRAPEGEKFFSSALLH